MDIDEADNAEKNSASGTESKNSDKAKGKRKLYVGSQSLGYRRDHMEVTLYVLFSVSLLGFDQ